LNAADEVNAQDAIANVCVERAIASRVGASSGLEDIEPLQNSNTLEDDIEHASAGIPVVRLGESQGHAVGAVGYGEPVGSHGVTVCLVQDGINGIADR